MMDEMVWKFNKKTGWSYAEKENVGCTLMMLFALVLAVITPIAMVQDVRKERTNRLAAMALVQELSLQEGDWTVVECAGASLLLGRGEQRVVFSGHFEMPHLGGVVRVLAVDSGEAGTTGEVRGLFWAASPYGGDGGQRVDCRLQIF